MARNRMGTDGFELEWSIQDGYVKGAEALGSRYVPVLLQFHLGNANGGKTFMTKGIPDTLTLYRLNGEGVAKLLWIEFKRHNGKLSTAQVVLIAALKKAGQDVIVCTSTREALDELLSRIGLAGQRKG